MLVGRPGELYTRGYSVMPGYWNSSEATAEAIDRAHWMHTGDLATVESEGYLNIVGRIKNMIIRGGENVYPARPKSCSIPTPRSAMCRSSACPTPRWRWATPIDCSSFSTISVFSVVYEEADLLDIAEDLYPVR